MRILIFILLLSSSIFAQNYVLKEIPPRYLSGYDSLVTTVKVIGVSDSLMLELKDDGSIEQIDTVYKRKTKTKETRVYNVIYGYIDSSGFVPVFPGSYYIEGEDDTPFRLKKAEIDTINGNL
jgi:hypothetical protein